MNLQSVLLVNIIPVNFNVFYAIKPKFFPKSSGVFQAVTTDPVT